VLNINMIAKKPHSRRLVNFRCEKSSAVYIHFFAAGCDTGHSPVACRGRGANGATAPGSQCRGHPKSEIAKIKML